MIRLKATTFVPPSRLWVVSRVACIQPCSPTASSCVSWSRSDVADPATQATEARRGGKAAIPLPRSVCSAGSRMTEPASERRPSGGALGAEWRLQGEKLGHWLLFIKDVLPSLQTCTVVVANFESSFRQTIIEVLGLRCLLRRVRALPPEPLPGYRIILSMRFLREFCRVSRAGILQGFLCA